MKKYLILFIALPLFAQPIDGPTLGPAPGTSAGVTTVNNLQNAIIITNAGNIRLTTSTNTHAITISFAVAAGTGLVAETNANGLVTFSLASSSPTNEPPVNPVTNSWYYIGETTNTTLTGADIVATARLSAQSTTEARVLTFYCTNSYWWYAYPTNWGTLSLKWEGYTYTGFIGTNMLVTNVLESTNYYFYRSSYPSVANVWVFTAQ